MQYDRTGRSRGRGGAGVTGACRQRTGTRSNAKRPCRAPSMIDLRRAALYSNCMNGASTSYEGPSRASAQADFLAYRFSRA